MQPPVRTDHEAQPPFPERRPKTSIPKSIGILNIVFGALLLLCTMCYASSLAMQSAMGPVVAAQQQQMQQMLEADRLQKLQEFQKIEQAAQDEKEKAEIRARQQALKAQPIPKMPDMTKFTQDASFQAYGI